MWIEVVREDSFRLVFGTLGFNIRCDAKDESGVENRIDGVEQVYGTYKTSLFWSSHAHTLAWLIGQQFDRLEYGTDLCP